MSASESATTGTLRVSAAPGARIHVQDGNFATVAAGNSLLEIELSKGLYGVSVSLAGKAEEIMTRVVPGETTEVRPIDGFLLGDEADDFLKQTGDHAFWKEKLKSVLSGTPATGASRVIVAVRSPDRNVSADVARSVSLAWAKDRQEDPIGATAELGGEGQSWSIRQFDTAPGIYQLRFETFERKRVTNTIYALENRIVLILLEYGAGTILTHTSEGVATERRRGIDPAQSLIVSFASEPNDEQLSRAYRTARTLLHGLSRPSSQFDNTQLEPLIAFSGDDPYLRLYLAASLLRSGPRDKSNLTGQHKVIAQLIELAGFDGPDVRSIFGKLYDAGFDVKLRPLRYPPMLDICWRWASELSVSHSNFVDRVPAVARAGNANPAFRPWLIVGHEAPLMAEEAQDTAEIVSASLEQLLDTLRVPIGNVIGDVEEMQPIRGISRFDRLSPVSLDLAMTAIRTGQRGLTKRETLKSIARDTGLPSYSLNAGFIRAIEEIDGEIES